MKKIIILMVMVVFFQTISANDIYDVDELPIKEYISMISNDLDMTIVLSDDIEENFTLMIPFDSNLTNGDHLKILIQILKKNHLNIFPHGNFFFISKDNEEDENKKVLQFIELKNVDYETVKPLFTTVSNVNHSYIASNKTIAFKSSKNEFIRISKLIEKLDKSPNQLKLKVTIIDTNLDKLKDYGTELKQLNTFTNNNNFFFNLLAYPFTVSSEVDKEQSSQLHSFIKFMDTNTISKLLSSPTVSLFDNKLSRFDVVKNIPYIQGTTTTKDGNTSSITSYSYKDVGLKLSVLPRIYNNNVYLDLEITSESIIDKGDKPTTSKSYIKQTIHLKKNKIFALTGINQTQNYNTLKSMPYLSDIPFLGWLFKTDNKNIINSNLTIFLQLIDNENLKVNDNEFVVEFPKLEKVKELTEHQKRVNEILGL